MSRKIKKTKGFAMSELLAVCVVVLLIFAILFANYLPLLAEYEVRISYNNVTSQYAAHYIRAIYKEAIENSETFVVTGINNGNGAFLVYQENEEGTATNSEIYGHVPTSQKEELKKLIEEYGVEEIVISNYKTENLKTGYNKNGKMAKYINYLPKYNKSIYTGEDPDNKKQLYRVTIKTKEFGYATTPILSDQITPDECFILNEKNSATLGNYFEVVGYHSQKTECGEAVVIGTEKYSNGNKKLQIKSIGAGAFSVDTTNYTNAKESNIKIKSVEIAEQVVSIKKGAFKDLTNLESYKIYSDKIAIGDYAFYNTGITSFNNGETTQDIGNVTSIGEYAFANNEKLTTINVKANITYGENVFSNNSTLTTIKFENESGDTINIVEKMFVNCGNSGSGISLTIPNNFKEKVCIRTDKETSNETKVNLSDCSNSDTDDYTYEIKELGDTISDYMFRTSNITSLTLNDNITSIGKLAFAQNTEENNSKVGHGNLNKLTIPKKVKKINLGAFKLLPIGTIEFSTDGELQVIGDNSFEMTSTQQDTEKTITIPKSVITIGVSAFSYRGITNIIFNNDSSTPINLYPAAFSYNKIKILTLPENVTFYMHKVSREHAGTFQGNGDLGIASWPQKMMTITYTGSGIEDTNELKKQEGTIAAKCFNGTNGSDVKDESGNITYSGTLTIPEYVTEIQTQAFASTTGINKIVFKCNETEDLTIADKVFYDSKELLEIDLPSRVKSIGDKALINEKEIKINNYSSTLENANWCSILAEKQMTSSLEYTCTTTSTGITAIEKHADGKTSTRTKTINHITSGEGGCVQ